MNNRQKADDISKATGHAPDSRTRSLAEAMILQSIEDLWNPVYKEGSLMFFKGEDFVLCSEIAGINYLKQLAMLKILANAGPKSRVTPCVKNAGTKCRMSLAMKTMNKK